MKERLAVEILQTEKRHTRFWFTAFIITLFIIVVKQLFKKKVQ